MSHPSLKATGLWGGFPPSNGYLAAFSLPSPPFVSLSSRRRLWSLGSIGGTSRASAVSSGHRCVSTGIPSPLTLSFPSQFFLVSVSVWARYG